MSGGRLGQIVIAPAPPPPSSSSLAPREPTAWTSHACIHDSSSPPSIIMKRPGPLVPLHDQGLVHARWRIEKSLP